MKVVAAQVAVCLGVWVVAAAADPDGSYHLDSRGVQVQLGLTPPHQLLETHRIASQAYKGKTDAAQRVYRASHTAPRGSGSQYAWAYEVAAPSSGDRKAAREERRGDVVVGQYSVVDPNGFLRVVDYFVRPETGFRATISTDENPAALAQRAAAQYSAHSDSQHQPVTSHQIYDQPIDNQPQSVTSHQIHDQPIDNQHQSVTSHQIHDQPIDNQHQSVTSHQIYDQPIDNQHQPVTSHQIHGQRIQQAIRDHFKTPQLKDQFQIPHVEAHIESPQSKDRLQSSQIRDFQHHQVQHQTLQFRHQFQRPQAQDHFQNQQSMEFKDHFRTPQIMNHFQNSHFKNQFQSQQFKDRFQTPHFMHDFQNPQIQNQFQTPHFRPQFQTSQKQPKPVFQFQNPRFRKHQFLLPQPQNVQNVHFRDPFINPQVTKTFNTYPQHIREGLFKHPYFSKHQFLNQETDQGQIQRQDTQKTPQNQQTTNDQLLSEESNKDKLEPHDTGDKIVNSGTIGDQIQIKPNKKENLPDQSVQKGNVQDKQTKIENLQKHEIDEVHHHVQQGKKDNLPETHDSNSQSQNQNIKNDQTLRRFDDGLFQNPQSRFHDQKIDPQTFRIKYLNRGQQLQQRSDQQGSLSPALLSSVPGSSVTLKSAVSAVDNEHRVQDQPIHRASVTLPTLDNTQVINTSLQG